MKDVTPANRCAAVADGPIASAQRRTGLNPHFPDELVISSELSAIPV